MFNRGLFSSANLAWATPEGLYCELDQEFLFTVDVCATEDNAKCLRYFSPEQDGLQQDWGGERCWMNPPYGRETIRWVQKARKEVEKGNTTVVCLLAARTDTRWWHEEVLPYARSIRFVRGRLRFGGSQTNAPFP